MTPGMNNRCVFIQSSEHYKNTTVMKKIMIVGLSLFVMGIISCSNGHKGQKENQDFSKGTFGYDLQFLKKQDSSLVVLKNEAGSAQVIVSPKYQAKVFTSTANGLSGHSFGWVHYPAFSGAIDSHMNAYGGENRFWLGPEGGIYSLFFKPNTKMVFDNWHTPPAYDSESWSLSSQKKGHSVTMHKDMNLLNYRGTNLSISVDRKISLLSEGEIKQALNISADDSVAMVGYETDQSITNTGDFAWTEKTGMPCIWILDMFTPSPSVVIAIPFHPFKDTSKRVATTDYFGDIPS